MNKECVHESTPQHGRAIRSPSFVLVTISTSSRFRKKVAFMSPHASKYHNNTDSHRFVVEDHSRYLAHEYKDNVCFFTLNNYFIC